MASIADAIRGAAKKEGGGKSVADRIRGGMEEGDDEVAEAKPMDDELYRSVAEDIASGDVDAIAAGLRSLCESMKE